jgi:hypothetical protein
MDRNRKTSKPKGSKLDKRRRAEYESVTSDDKWDLSSWPTWAVTGRVLPERCDVTIPTLVARGVGAGGRCLIEYQVIKSHLLAKCAVEKSDPSLFEIVDIVRSAIAAPIDYIAFRNRGAYEIVLDLCVNNQTGAVDTVPIFEPIFDRADKSGLCFDADTSKILIPQSCISKPEFKIAVHDLTAAIR